MRTEENLQTTKMLSRSLTMPMPEREADGGDDDGGNRRNSVQLLFPHLFKKKGEAADVNAAEVSSEANATPQKAEITPKKNIYFSPGTLILLFVCLFVESVLDDSH